MELRDTTEPAPARRVLDAAERANQHSGHENLGFLSSAAGFLPLQAPLQELPASHRAWDDIAADLPRLYRMQALRDAFDELPVLSAEAGALPDAAVCRASSLLSMFAHAYYRARPEPAERMPPCIQQPWEDVTRRLGRPAPCLSYVDLIAYNWRVLDPREAHPRRVENMALLTPTVGNREEEIFYLTQVEMLAESAPIVEAVVRAQEAVLREDATALARELLLVSERLRYLTEVSFQKVDPNPYARSYVDPVVWAKTVAPFAVPMQEGVQGPSGTSSPVFHVLDVFFGRRHYGSVLGKESIDLRRYYPPHWTDFLAALNAVPIRRYVEERGDRGLNGLFAAVLNEYAGEKGFLGVHRLKVYGYLETAFKVGRSITIGGFAGLFKDRAWEDVDGALHATQRERFVDRREHRFVATARGERLAGSRQGPAHVVLDVAGTGIRFQPGDRCGILPENDPELVERTLNALRAAGEEAIHLDAAWRQALQRPGHEFASVSLREMLRLGIIRPVERRVAQTLHAITASSRLRAIIAARAEDQWELWDLLQLLAEGGYDPRRLWKAEPWDRESICRIVRPPTFRLYSIACAMDDSAAASASDIHLSAGELTYRTQDSPVSRACARRGTASRFLARMADAPGSARTTGQPVTVSVVPARRFHLPSDPRTPIVMFAGGAGIAPFRGFLQERARQHQAGENWLFFGIRTRDDLYFGDELAALVAAGRLRLDVACSREDSRLCVAPCAPFAFADAPRSRIDQLMLEEETARRLWDLLRDEGHGGRGARFYVCGQTGFAAAVFAALKHIARRYGGEQGVRLLYQMAADERYLQDVFTTYSEPAPASRRLFDASEVVLHNEAGRGYWMVIHGRVYDVTEFMHLHPGGQKILAAYAGLDASRAYRAVRHDVSPEVDALLGLYEIGVIRRLNFRAGWGVAVTPHGLRYVSAGDAFRAWVRLLYMVVEMENAFGNDVSFLDRVTTKGEEASALTPYKVRMLADAHTRFIAGYVDGLVGEDLQALWAITTGLWAPREDVRRIRREVDLVSGTPEAHLVRALGERLAVADHARGTAPEPSPVASVPVWMEALCQTIVARDRAFLAGLKAALRNGVQAFEELEADVMPHGGRRLLEALGQVPSLLQTYYEGLGGEAEALSSGSLTPSPQTSAVRPRTAFAGHGF
ncbi:MAG TPA: cytochrome b5 domain-containing protein [Vicinamibacterales bacterium]|nr:cytochrome b5 domain-containing protein [Vicinamibacterales bacterium]